MSGEKKTDKELLVEIFTKAEIMTYLTVPLKYTTYDKTKYVDENKLILKEDAQRCVFDFSEKDQLLSVDLEVVLSFDEQRALNEKIKKELRLSHYLKLKEEFDIIEEI